MKIAIWKMAPIKEDNTHSLLGIYHFGTDWNFSLVFLFKKKKLRRSSSRGENREIYIRKSVYFQYTWFFTAFKYQSEKYQVNNSKTLIMQSATTVSALSK